MSKDEPAQIEDDEAGMMLAEVLVGLAIITIASFAMLRVFSTAATGVDRVDVIRNRMALAENLLSELVSTGVASAGTRNGQIGTQPWAIETRQIGLEAKDAWPAYQVKIRVGDPALPPLLETVVLGSAP